MRSDTHQALVELSCLFHPDPAVIFQRILEIITGRYSHTMAMLNILQDDRIEFRAVINPHPGLQQLGSMSLADSY